VVVEAVAMEEEREVGVRVEGALEEGSKQQNY